MGWGVSRGTRAVLYFFFAVVSLLLGSIAVFTGGFIGAFGGSAKQPVVEIYGSLVLLVAVVARPSCSSSPRSTRCYSGRDAEGGIDAGSVQ